MGGHCSNCGETGGCDCFKVNKREAIERVARAICQAEAKRHYGIDRGADEAWEAATDYARSEWLADAEAALSALDMGVSEEMIEAGVQCIYRSGMVDADTELWDGDVNDAAKEIFEAMQAARLSGVVK